MKNTITTCLALLALTGCTITPTPAPAPTPKTVPDQYARYRCGGGQEFGVTFQSRGARALLERDGRSDLLQRVGSASGAKYSDGKTTLWVKGKNAVVEAGGQVVLRDCIASGSR